MKHPTGGLQPATLPALPGGMFQAWNRQHQPEATTIDGGGKSGQIWRKFHFSSGSKNVNGLTHRASCCPQQIYPVEDPPDSQYRKIGITKKLI